MNIFRKTVLISLLTAGILASCSSSQSAPTVSQADKMETAISTVSTTLAETQRSMPTNTFLPLPTISFLATPLSPHTLTTFPGPTIGPTSTPLVFTDPSIPLSERIVYYYFVMPAENPIPEGAVGTFPPLAPTYADQTYTSDTAADLRTALEIVLHEDDRRVWNSSDLEIVDVTFGNGHADVIMQGEYFAAGGSALWAAGRQILLTVFANPSVQTATITLNGRTIWNLGISRSEDAIPDDYVYTRAEWAVP